MFLVIDWVRCVVNDVANKYSKVDIYARDSRNSHSPSGMVRGVRHEFHEVIMKLNVIY
jgi:hypothetical protein